jgi:hypothetical protein
MPESAAQGQAAAVLQKFEEGRARCQRLAQTRTLLALLLLVALVGWIAAITMKARSMYTQQAFAPPLRKSLSRLEGPTLHAAKSVYQEVRPVYEKKLVGKLDEIQPRLETEILTEAKALNETARKQVEDGLNGVLDKLAAAYLKAGKGELGFLQDQARQDQFAARLKTQIDQALKQTVAHFFDKYSVDFDRIAKTLADFDTQPYTNLPKPELRLAYLHLWLQIFDLKILEELRYIQMERAEKQAREFDMRRRDMETAAGAKTTSKEGPGHGK